MRIEKTHGDLHVNLTISCVTGVCMEFVSSPRGYEQKCEGFVMNSRLCMLHHVNIRVCEAIVSLSGANAV